MYQVFVTKTVKIIRPTIEYIIYSFPIQIHLTNDWIDGYVYQQSLNLAI